MELNDLLGKNILTNGEEEFISLLDYLEKNYNIRAASGDNNNVIRIKFWNNYPVFCIRKDNNDILFGSISNNTPDYTYSDIINKEPIYEMW